MIDFHYTEAGRNKDIVVVVLSGKLNEQNCQYLFECIEGQINDGKKKLILDCSQLEYISSMGLGMLVRVHARMQKIGGDVRLAALQSTVVDVLSIVGLNRFFQNYPTVEDAVAVLGG